MGCGSSAQAYEPEQPGYKGLVFIELKNAVLERDVALLGTMNTYMQLIMDHQIYKSDVSDGSGKYPKWPGCNTTFKKKVGYSDVIVGQVWSQNLVTSDVLVGEGAFSLTSLRKTSTPTEICFNIYEKGQVAGRVTVQVVFTMHETGKDLDYIKAPDTNGRLSVEPKEAKLTRDANWISKMDPLVCIRFGDENLSSAVATDSGKNPHWIDKLQFTKDQGEDTLVIELWNFSDFGANDFLGTGYVSITECLNLGEKQIKKVPLKYLDNPAGEITVVMTFETSEPQKYMPPGQQAQQKVEQKVAEIPKQLANFALNTGNLMAATFQQLVQNNRVEFTYPNGDSYSGEVQNNVRWGQGTLRFVNGGGFYTGQFLNDNFNGQGELNFGGIKYIGQFVNGKKEGKGTQEWQNNQKYSGLWLANNMHGDGEWTFPTGQKKQGFWQNGNRMKWNDEAQNRLLSGRALPQGGQINSMSGLFTLTLASDGKIFIFNNQTRTPIFRAVQSNRPIYPPFWLRLENHGELVLIDQTGQPYWTSGRPNTGVAPFSALQQDDGRLCIIDSTNLPVWYSH